MNDLDAAWRELEADALASDGPIRDSDVKDAIKRNRPHIEAAALASSPAPAGPEAPCPDCGHPNDWHEQGCVKGDCDRHYPAPAGLDVERGALLRLAAHMVRLEGGCESGHKPGQWHMHEKPYHRIGRQLAAIARAATRPAEDAGAIKPPEEATLVATHWTCPICGQRMLAEEAIAHLHSQGFAEQEEQQ